MPSVHTTREPFTETTSSNDEAGAALAAAHAADTDFNTGELPRPSASTNTPSPPLASFEPTLMLLPPALPSTM
jgi:hypothetical protein